jgi:hypothetical protein
MRYQTFISEIEELLGEGKRLLESSVTGHKDAHFAAWLHKLKMLVSNVESYFHLPWEMGLYREYRSIRAMADYDDDMRHFRNDLIFTIREIENVIHRYKQDGVPPKRLETAYVLTKTLPLKWWATYWKAWWWYFIGIALLFSLLGGLIVHLFGAERVLKILPEIAESLSWLEILKK